MQLPLPLSTAQLPNLKKKPCPTTHRLILNSSRLLEPESRHQQMDFLDGLNHHRRLSNSSSHQDRSATPFNSTHNSSYSSSSSSSSSSSNQLGKLDHLLSQLAEEPMFQEAQQWDKHPDSISHKALLVKDWCQCTIETESSHILCKQMEAKSPLPHQAVLQLQRAPL